MGTATKISWTDHTFNPWIGCRPVSPGCKNCYAARLVAGKLRHQFGASWGRDGVRKRTQTPWRNVRAWAQQAVVDGRRHLVFCGSLCDVFEDRPELNALRAELWRLIGASRSLVFQLLTKRPGNIAAMLPPDWGRGWENVWIGTSVENQGVAWRIDALRLIPAAVRFISYEPALGPLDVSLEGIDWVIYGGESGPGYRPENKQWARDIRQECRRVGAAFFHKQSAGARTEMGIELDGEIVHDYPEAARRSVQEAALA